MFINLIKLIKKCQNLVYCHFKLYYKNKMYFNS